MKLTDRLAHAWNAFTSPQQTTKNQTDVSAGSIALSSPSRLSGPSMFANKNIVENIINRMAVDVSSMRLVHARVDENENYLENIPSGLNECLTIEANVVQCAPSCWQAVVLTLLLIDHA